MARKPVARKRFRFTADLWEWEAQDNWFFVSLPEDIADDIEGLAHRAARGFGSVRVEVTIGSSTWRTSVFPDRKRGTYVLPVKKAIRVAEGLDAGSRPDVELRPLVGER